MCGMYFVHGLGSSCSQMWEISFAHPHKQWCLRIGKCKYPLSTIPHSLHGTIQTKFDYRILTGNLALGNINKRHYNRCFYLNSMAKIYHSLRLANITMPSMPIAYGDVEAVDCIHGAGASMVNLDTKTYSRNIDQKLCNFSTIK